MKTYLVIHHTAPPLGFKETIKSIEEMHIPKFGRIYYQIIIDREGLLHIIHSKTNYRGIRKESIDIAVMGDFTREKPTQKQLDRLAGVILAKDSMHTFESILGHKDAIAIGLAGKQSECPGTLMEDLEIYKNRIKVLIDRQETGIEEIRRMDEAIWQAQQDLGTHIEFITEGEYHIKLTSKNSNNLTKTTSGSMELKTYEGYVEIGNNTGYSVFQVLLHELDHALLWEVMDHGIHQDPQKYFTDVMRDVDGTHQKAWELFLQRYDPTKHFINSKNKSMFGKLVYDPRTAAGDEKKVYFLNPETYTRSHVDDPKYFIHAFGKKAWANVQTILNDEFNQYTEISPIGFKVNFLQAIINLIRKQ